MGHTYTSLNYHLIFSTKGRAPLLEKPMRPRLYAYLGGILRELGGELVSIGGVEDHVHLLVRLKPTIPLAEVMRNLKGSSSRWLNEERHGVRFAWQGGYTAFSVSRSNMDVVERYIARQEEHHRTRAFKEELLDFLRAHRVDFDERYLWD